MSIQKDVKSLNVSRILQDSSSSFWEASHGAGESRCEGWGVATPGVAGHIKGAKCCCNQSVQKSERPKVAAEIWVQWGGQLSDFSMVTKAREHETSWNAGLWNTLEWQLKGWNADRVAAGADCAPIQIWVDIILAWHNSKTTVSYPIVQRSGLVQGGQGAARRGAPRSY